MRTHTGVATHVFGTLAKQGINIELISTSEVRINVITQLEQGDAGVKSLREVFFLPEQP
jgi:aspartate kinase